MTIPVETAFCALLLGSPTVKQALVDRISPHAASQRAKRPYAVYSRISSLPERHLLAASGLVFVRLQLDLYGDDFDQLLALAESIRMRADGYSGAIDIDGESIVFQNVELVDTQTSYETPNDGSDAGPHRYRMDFRISAPEPIPSLT